jgi:hypothetical protein
LIIDNGRLSKKELTTKEDELNAAFHMKNRSKLYAIVGKEQYFSMDEMKIPNFSKNNFSMQTFHFSLLFK